MLVSSSWNRGQSRTHWGDHPGLPIRELRGFSGGPRFVRGLAEGAARAPVPDLLHTLIHAPLRSPVPVAMQIPDLSFIHHPGHFPAATGFRLRTAVRFQVHRVRTVTTVSEFSRRDLITTYGLKPESVVVIPNSVAPRSAPSPEAVAAVRMRHGLTGQYFCHLGNIQPRKNVARLVRAFSMIRRSEPELDQHLLVLVGARPWPDPELDDALREAAPGSVIQSGPVPDEERDLLLAGATALVYPSLFEGFGLPPLEAMALGTPVVAARSGAIPEVVGDGALLVQPESIAEIGQAMVRVAGEPELRRGLIERGRRRVLHYSPASMGRQAIESFRVAAFGSLSVLAAVCLTVACGGGPSARPAPNLALPPAGAPIAVGTMAYDSDRTGNYEIYARSLGSGAEAQLTNEPRWDSWWPRLSPDHRRMLFYRTPRGTHDRDFKRAALWLMTADGQTLQEIRPAGTDGWETQGHAEWSPDGTHLVMLGGRASNPQIYITTSNGSAARQLTNRGGVSIDPSWSPDGKTIAFIGCPNAVCFEADYEVYVVAAAGGEARRMTNDRIRDQDPYYSPDGSRIAWLSETDTHGLQGLSTWNIRIMNADGSGIRLVTNDRNINSKPQWAPDGSRIFFHRFEPGISRHWSIFSIRADGAEMRDELVRVGGNNEFPSF